MGLILFGQEWGTGKMTNIIRETKWTALFSLIITLLFLNLVFPYGDHIFHQNTPVVNMKGQLVANEPNSITVHIQGEVLRPCSFVSVGAMYQRSDSPKLISAFLEQVGNVPKENLTRPVGENDLGLWKIYPTKEAVRVLVYTHHECGKESVVSKVAEIQL